MGAVESNSVKSARKAKDKLHKACERASETRERTLHGQEQDNAHGKHITHHLQFETARIITASPVMIGGICNQKHKRITQLLGREKKMINDKSKECTGVFSQ